MCTYVHSCIRTGRFDVTVGVGGIFLEGKAGNCFFPWSSVSHVNLVPVSVSAKKEGEELMSIQAREPVNYNGKPIKSMLWCLSKGGKTHSAKAENVSITGFECDVASGLVAAGWKGSIVIPRKELFVAANGKNVFLRCNKGIQEGALYPLSSGILFVKPSVFLPSDTIASITAGRGGSATTRYVDLIIRYFLKLIYVITSFRQIIQHHLIIVRKMARITSFLI